YILDKELEDDLTFNITAKDSHVISVYCWDRVENPRAVLQIFHGMAEHAGRYERFAKYLNTQGIVVIGNDHRGHGKTSQFNGKPGVIGQNGFYNIVEDEFMLTKMLKEKYPNTPIYVLAHSFGSFVGQEYITNYGSEIDGLILSGSAAQTGAEFKFAKILASIQAKLFGEEKEAKLLEKLSFGGYNKKIYNPSSGFDWISRDTEEVKKYDDDPFCGFTCSIGFYYYFTAGLINLYKKDKLAKIPKTLPIYIISGQDDPVGQYGQSVKKLYDIYQALGLSDLNVKLYQGSRHELLNELNRDEVTQDILKWINERLTFKNN
ncbi:MAG: alpha/beta hydrolase, partial [Ruminiclostridium sp.]